MDHVSQHEEDAPAPAAGEEASLEGMTKTPLCFGIRRFLCDSARSKAVLAAFCVSMLLSFSIGLTVAIVPEVLTDRYARLYHGYSAEEQLHQQQLPPPCWEFEKSLMPEACTRGADDALTGSAWGMFIQNMVIFFFNASIGSYSDVHGRRSLLIVSIFLNTLVPAALLAMQLIASMDPFWYYASNAFTGMVPYNALVFATLSDNCPEEYRAGRFATNLAGFYFGFATAPTLALWMSSHTAASWWSLALSTVALAFSVVFLPETLPAITSVLAEEHEETDPAAVEAAAATSTEAEVFESNGCENNSSRTPCPQTIGAIVLRPVREMAILNRNGVMRLLALASFLAATVYSTDVSLVLFYIEEHLNVREDDIASMFFIMGVLGAILQGIGLQPIVYVLGEHGLLVLAFASGTLHNFLYGVARNKTTITVALSLSQLTKLSYPVLSSLSSRQVGLDEQGQIQGALLALNALGGAIGPISMNWIYERTKTSDKYFGPGTMFLFASFLYFLGTIVISSIPSTVTGGTGSDGVSIGSGSSTGNDTQITDTGSTSNTLNEADLSRDRVETSVWEDGDLEEPLLLQLGGTSTI